MAARREPPSQAAARAARIRRLSSRPARSPLLTGATGQDASAFCREARGTPVIVEILVDGSFVTSKAEPNDIDLLLILPADHAHSGQLRPFEYNLLSRRRVRRSYGFDVLVARAASAEYQEYIEFFAQVRGAPDITKGLLRVRP